MNGLAQAAVPAISGPALDNKRVAAGVIDLFVLFLVGFILGTFAGAYTPGASAVITAWALYYYFALESLTGQTLGKKLMGLRVAKPDGSPPEMRQIAIRTVLRLIDGWALYLVGLIVMLATGERRQRLGDVAAKTIVTTAVDDPPKPGGPDGPAEAPAPVAPLHQPEVPEEVEPAPEPVAVPAAVEEPPPFEPYRVPDPTVPLAPAPSAAEESHIELVPDPPADGEKPRIEIVSPIDLIMGEDEPQHDDDVPPQPA